MAFKNSRSPSQSTRQIQRADIVIRAPEGPLTGHLKSITDRASAERAISRILDGKRPDRRA